MNKNVVITRFTTANVPPGAESDFEELAHESDVLAIQESGGRRDEDYFDNNWIVVQGEGRMRARCSVALRRRYFRVVRWENPVLHLSKLYKSANRRFLSVKYQDKRTGRYHLVINVHFGPHADDPQGGISDYPRGKLVSLGITVLVALVQATSPRSNIHLGGDFNIDADKDIRHKDSTDLIERLDKVGMKNSVKTLGNVRDTHGKNHYDQWFMRLKRYKAWMYAHATRRKRKSDHRAYTVWVKSTKRKAWR